MRCGSCHEEIAENFDFCPHCGAAMAPPLEHPAFQNQASASQVQPPAEVRSERKILVGTWMFGAFAAISLLVSIVHGLIPIYLLESAAWAGVAWYWQKKKPQNETAKLIVVIIGVVVAIGEVAQVASRWKGNDGDERQDPYDFTNIVKQGGPEAGSASTPVASGNSGLVTAAAPNSSVPAPTDSVLTVPSSSLSPKATHMKKATLPVTDPVTDSTKGETSSLWSCNQELSAGESREVAALGPADLALIKASMENPSGQRSFLFKIHNGTHLCITSAEVFLDIETENLAKREATKTASISPETS